MKQRAFTLAEVLITLAIIGVVAAMAIPGVISNAQQQEFKTGLRKAVSVLNSAITMNIALEGESPYDNHDLFRYLQRHMSVMSSTTNLRARIAIKAKSGYPARNAAFYTTDGMRFEFADNPRQVHYYMYTLYENQNVKPCFGPNFPDYIANTCGGCGSYGLASNPNGTKKPPCMVFVDVNGDRKPNPSNASCFLPAEGRPEGDFIDCIQDVKLSDPKGKNLTDYFSIMITDSAAIPYGVAAQKAMYQAQK